MHIFSKISRFQTAAMHGLDLLRIPLNSQTTVFVVNPTQPRRND